MKYRLYCPLILFSLGVVLHTPAHATDSTLGTDGSITTTLSGDTSVVINGTASDLKTLLSDTNATAYTLPAATTTTLGGIKVGTGLLVSADGTLSASNSGGTTYTLPMASSSVLGGVKVGSGLSIDNNGILSNTYVYNLPAATSSTIGGVKPGTGLSVASDGTLSNTYSYTLPTATSSALGGVKVGSGLAVAGDGTLSNSYSYSLPTASSTSLGGVKVGSGLTIGSDGTLSASGGSTSSYTLPIASSSTLGGIKLGTGLTATADGTVSASGGVSVPLSLTDNRTVNKDNWVNLPPTISILSHRTFTDGALNVAPDLRIVDYNDHHDLILLSGYGTAGSLMNMSLNGSYQQGIALQINNSTNSSYAGEIGIRDGNDNSSTTGYGGTVSNGLPLWNQNVFMQVASGDTVCFDDNKYACFGYVTYGSSDTRNGLEFGGLTTSYTDATHLRTIAPTGADSHNLKSISMYPFKLPIFRLNGTQGVVADRLEVRDFVLSTPSVPQSGMGAGGDPSTTPSSATCSENGKLTYDANFIYVCVAGSYKKAPLSAF